MNKNILVISPYNPFIPVLGGSARSVRTRIERISREANVTLLTFFDAKQDESVISSIGITSFFARYTPAQNLTGTGFRRLISIISGRLMDFRHFDDRVKAMLPVLTEALEKQKFDLIQVEDIVIAGIARHLPGKVKKLLFLHNVLTTYCTRIRDSKPSGVGRIAATVELFWIRRFEKSVLRFFNAAIVITSEEHRQIRSISPSIRIHTIPLEIDTHAIVPRSDKPDFPSVAFCGTLSYPPNKEAVLYFAKAILPLVHKKIPDIVFYIIGQNPDAEVKRLESTSIIVTGAVSSVQEHLSKAGVVVVPIKTGAGMRIKILEAFAMGKAVVSTTLGAEGISCTNAVDIMLADSPAAFAEKVCLLLQNPAQADELGACARRLAESEYDAAVVWKKWQAVYNELF